MLSFSNIASLAVCPKCRSDIDLSDLSCTNSSCTYNAEHFPSAGGQPVLIDFENSIFSRENFAGENAGSSVIERSKFEGRASAALRRIIHGRNQVALAKSLEMLKLAKLSNPHPRILVIGGGAIGSGAEPLYEDPNVTIVGTDVYAAAHTCLLCDGHQLPFRDGAFEGVWIQAVLEHVLEPQTIVDEIHRVLKPDGVVFANTPFMQQVHEGAYDFTRFTLSGHRWLFRRFDQIEAGISAGSGVALLWAIRHFVRSLGGGRRVSVLASLPFFWLRFLGNSTRRQAVADAASGFYFLGRKSEHELSPRDMVNYYVNRGITH
jgi:SAM-dependent methyltransferase